MKVIIKKILLIKLFFFCFSHIIYGQPYYFQHISQYDSAYEIVLPEIIEKLDLSNNSVSEFISLNDNIIHQIYCDPTYSWMAIEVPYLDGLIYNISNPTVYYTIPEQNSGFGGGILYSNILNKLYYFDLREDSEILTSINLTTSVIDSISEINYSYNQTIGNQEAFFSTDQDLIYFNIADTLYADTVNNQDYLCYFSTSLDQIIQKTKLSTFGYPNSDGYLLHRGRNGKAVVESFYKNEDKECKFRFYNFENNTGSLFINYSGYTTPYFINNGEYLVLPETEDSVGFDYNTGKLFIYSFETGNLIKTIILPAGGKILTFDSYPNNIYYTIDIDLPTRQIYTLKMDSIFNVLDLTSLNPSSVIAGTQLAVPLTITGHGFDSLSAIYFNGVIQTTTFVSDSVLTTEIVSPVLATVGNYPVWVTDQYATSDTLTFSVIPQPPIITKISPSISLPYDGIIDESYDIITVTITGGNFNPSSVAYFNGSAKPTSFVSTSVITFRILTTDIGTTAKNVNIWIETSGVSSNLVTFSVVTSLPNPITPILECVRKNSLTSYTAFWGYNNVNSADIYIPISSKNKFTPLPIDRYQTRIFLSGRRTNTFSVNFNGYDLIWTLNGINVTASKKSPACP